METNKELLQQAIEQVDGCMCPTQIEPEDAAAWQVVRAALAKQADAAPVDAVREALQMLYDDRDVIEVITAKQAAQVATALAQCVVSEAVPIGTIKEGRFSNRFEWASDEIASDSSLIGASVHATPPAAPVALSDADIRNRISNAIYGYGCMLEDHAGVVDAIAKDLAAATQPTDSARPQPSALTIWSRCDVPGGRMTRTDSRDVARQWEAEGCEVTPPVADPQTAFNRGWQARDAEMARLQVALSGADKRVRSLEILVDSYGPKSLQYDIEHPCDGLNALADRGAKQVQGELPAFMQWFADNGGPYGSYKDAQDVFLAGYRSAMAQRVGCGEPYGWINAGTERKQTTHATLHIGTENPWFDSANAFPVYTTPPAVPASDVSWEDGFNNLLFALRVIAGAPQTCDDPVKAAQMFSTMPWVEALESLGVKQSPAVPVALSDDQIVAKFRNWLGLIGEREAILSYSKSLLRDVAATQPTDADKRDANRYRFLEEQCSTGSYRGIISRKAIDAAIAVSAKGGE